MVLDQLRLLFKNLLKTSIFLRIKIYILEIWHSMFQGMPLVQPQVVSTPHVSSTIPKLSTQAPFGSYSFPNGL
jgi:hypothetical protein